MSKKAALKPTTPSPKAEKPAAPKPKVGATLMAIAIKPSPMPVQQEDGSFKCTMNFVSPAGQETLIGCTHTTYLQIQQNRYYAVHTHDFKLRLNEDGVVRSIDQVPRRSENTLFKTSDAVDEDRVLLLVDRDGTVNVKSSPPGLPNETVDDIVSAAEAAEGVFDSDQFLGGRFLIESLTKAAGQTTLAVNPVAR